MATAAIDYDFWSLQDLRVEATKRSIYFHLRMELRPSRVNLEHPIGQAKVSMLKKEKTLQIGLWTLVSVLSRD